VLLLLLYLTATFLIISSGICLADSKLTQEKVVQFVISHGGDSGGHLHVGNLPSTMVIGETYPITLTFSFEWSDVSNITIDIDGIYVGLVSEKNLIGSAQGIKTLAIGENSQKIEPDWIGFDYIAVNKKVKIGDSVTVTAYITPESITSSGKAYLMFKMIGSVTGGVPSSTIPIKANVIYSPSALEVEVVPKQTPTPTETKTFIETPTSAQHQQLEKPETPGFEILIGIFAGVIAIILVKIKIILK
jgi:sporulation protein YlmC with PRC-barrel domain